MKKQSVISMKRNEMQQENRRQHLRNVFGQHRRTLKQELTKLQKQQFDKIYPQIDEDNFQAHLSFIYKYSYNDDYNFRLVAFNGYLYQFLLSHPDNQQALKILESLSYYEELQFPQTEELAMVLVQNLQKNSLTILQIVYNLLQTSTYFACLRDYLIQLDFNHKIQNLLNSHQNKKQKQAQNYSQQLYLGIMCSFISTQPLVQNHFFEELLKKTLQLSDNYPERNAIVLITLSDLFSSIQQEKLKAELVLKIYGKVMIKEYFNCEYQVVNIIFYSVKCGIMIENSYWKLLSISLQSINSQTVQKIIMICEILAKKENFYQDMTEMFTSNNFLNRFMKTYDLCQQKSKLRIIQVLSSFARQILVDTQQINEDNRLSLDQLINIFKNGLQQPNQVIVEKIVDLIFFLLQVTNENQIVQLPIREYLQQQGVVQILTNTQMDKQYLSQKIQFILGLLQEQGKNDKGHI